MALLKTSTPPLSEERVRALRDDINKFLDAKVQDIKRGKDGGSPCEGVPDSMLLGILMNRSEGCLCQAFLNILEQGQ
jgi:hypothetical protein